MTREYRIDIEGKYECGTPRLRISGDRINDVEFMEKNGIIKMISGALDLMNHEGKKLSTKKRTPELTSYITLK